MKIAFVSEHASPLAALTGVDVGGQNVHVAELAAALVRAGHDVTVFTRRDQPRLPNCVLTAAGYTVRHLEAGPAHAVPKDDLWPLMPAFAQQLGVALDDELFDVAHAHFWMSGWATLEAARPRGLATVLTFHALGAVKRRHLGADDPSPAVRLSVERDLAAGVDHVIATCTDEVAEVRAAGMQPRQISVVPCGVDVDRFTPTGRVLGGRTHRHRVVTLGRLVPRKGFGTVVEAMTRLTDTELVLAGGAPGYEPERERLHRLAHDLGVSARVRLLPQISRTDVPTLLRSADVVAAVPWYEPFGIVPIEAMACGVPVVAAAVGGMLDTVHPGVTGALVPPQDPTALATAIEGLLRQPMVRAAYGRKAAQLARERYSWDSVAARTVEAYQRTLREQGRRWASDSVVVRR